jgi:pimeloyl-ACP methyl ester carboxylesterase
VSEPLVLLHGFTGTARVWDLVVPALERRFDVLAPTLPGHYGGPPIDDDVTTEGFLDMVEAMLEGIDTAHLVGNSLGGYLALRLAARGSARSVVALAPAGGWADREFAPAVFARFETWQAQLRALAPHVDAIARSPDGRRRATEAITVRSEHLPADLVAHQMLGTAMCPGTGPLIRTALREGYDLEPSLVQCPVRIVWGTRDGLLPWPSAAERYRSWFPHADWVVLEDVGHCPQLDVPLETAQLIADWI